MAFSTSTIWEKRHGVAHHPLTSNVVHYLVGLGCALPLALWLEPMHVTWTRSLGWALAYLVICNSIFAISLLLMLIRNGEATRVSALFFLVPPVSTSIAWLMIDEAMALLACWVWQWQLPVCGWRPEDPHNPLNSMGDLIGRTTTREIKRGGRREGILLGTEPDDHRCRLIDLQEPATRDLREHVVDVPLTHLIK